MLSGDLDQSRLTSASRCVRRPATVTEMATRAPQASAGRAALWLAVPEVSTRERRSAVPRSPGAARAAAEFTFLPLEAVISQRTCAQG